MDTAYYCRTDMEKTAAYIVFIVVISSGAVLFLAFIAVDIFLLLRFRQLKMKNEMLEIKNQFTQELQDARIESAEQTMNDMSKELHDNILQHLTIAVLQLNGIQKTSPEAAESLEPSIQLLRETSAELRQLSHVLSSEMHRNTDLKEATVRIRESLERTGIIRTDFEVDTLPVQFDKSRELFLLRILQEMINNSIKYARATLLTCRVYLQDMHIVCEYQDNGRGFDKTEHKDGLGMISMENRLKLMRAKWEIDTAPGKGFSFKAWIPVEN